MSSAALPQKNVTEIIKGNDLTKIIAGALHRVVDVLHFNRHFITDGTWSPGTKN